MTPAEEKQAARERASASYRPTKLVILARYVSRIYLRTWRSENVQRS